MGLSDVMLGYQTWSDYVSANDQIAGFDATLGKRLSGIERTLKVGLANQEQHGLAVEAGLGAIGKGLSVGFDELTHGFEIGLQEVSKGIDRLGADFNLAMGDVIWKLETLDDSLTDILKTLRAPLDTQAKELRRRAEDAYLNGWYQESLKDFLESEQRNYQDFSVHRSIGNIYLYHLIDAAKALEYYQKAAKYARPRDVRQAAEAEYFCAVVYGIQGRLVDGLRHAGNATSLNPEFHEAFYLSAAFAAMVGDAATTRQTLDRAIRGDPRYHLRATTDQSFRNIRSQVNQLLDELFLEAKEDASKAMMEVKQLASRFSELLPKDYTALTEQLHQARSNHTAAATYADFVDVLDEPEWMAEMLTEARQRLVAAKTSWASRIKEAEEGIEREARHLVGMKTDLSEKQAKAFTGAFGFCMFVGLPLWFVSCGVGNVIMGGENGVYGMNAAGYAFLFTIVASGVIVVFSSSLAGGDERKRISLSEARLVDLKARLKMLRESPDRIT